MPTIKFVIVSALAGKQQSSVALNNKVLQLAINQLTDEVSLIEEEVSKEKMTKIIQTKRDIGEQEFFQYGELDEEVLSELAGEKDTILSELAEILRQLE